MKTAKQSIDLEYKGTKKRLNLRTALISLCMFAFVGTSAQTGTVTVKLRNASVKELFSAIEKQTSYRFSYRDAEIKGKGNVTISATNRELKQLLEGELSKLGLKYAVSGNKIIVTPVAAAASAQPKKVTGKVVDANGEPVIGATIKEQGTANGTITDFDGNFALAVADNAMLEVSYIGYKSQELKAVAGKILSVTLKEDTEVLDEVVVVGYGTQRKGNLTGSVAAVKSEQLTVAPVGNVTNTLAGQLPGLIAKQSSGLPGSDAASLSIRGFDSPLVIVDGVESDFSNLDQNQIESISILKDGSASIYGARAGNGVILVTTKRGTAQKPTITVNSSYTWQGVTSMLHPASSGERAQMERETHLNSGQPEATAPWSEEDVSKFFSGDDPSYVNSDWYGYVFRNWAPQQNHNVSVRGGNDRIKYFGMFAYTKQETLIKKNGGDYSRYNIQANMDAAITKNLSLTIDYSVNYEDQMYAPRGMGVGGYFWQDYYSTKPWYPTELPDPTKYSWGGIDTGGVYVASNMDISGYSKTRNKETRTSATLLYDVPYVKGLKLKAFVNYKDYNNYGKTFSKPVMCYTYNVGTDTYTEVPALSQQASASESYSRGSVFTQQYSLSYENLFGDHRVNGMVLYELIDYKDNLFSAGRQNFVTSAIDQLYAGSASAQSTSGSASEMGRVSWVGRLNYGYQDKYLLEFIFRADASAKFAPGKRWGYFPGVSLGWNIHQEKFMGNFTNLDQLKLRASYGRSGNDNVGNFQYLAGYSVASSGYLVGGITSPMIYTTGLANSDLTWEKMSIYNVGVDYSLFNRKLFGTAEYFYRKRVGIPGYQTASLPFTFGATLPQVNLNDMSTKGFEVSVGTSGQVKDFAYMVEGNISWSRSKWLKKDEPEYTDPDEIRIYQQTDNWTDRNIGYKSAGLFTSQEEIDNLPYVYQDLGGNQTLKPGDIKYVDVNGDGVLNWKDQVYLGPGSTPHWMYGLNASMKYKSFDLQFLLQGAFGYMAGVDLYSNEIVMSSKLYEIRWTEENNNADALAPRLGGAASNYWTSDYTLRKSAYLRLKNIALGYELPKSLVSKLNVQKVRLYVAATNLFTISNLNSYGLDPEVPQMFYYPQQRTISVGANVSF